MQKSKRHIVLACTARKRGSRGGYPRLREVPRAPVLDRVAEWADRVSAAPRPQRVADMYAGEYWQEGLRLASCAGSAQADVSVISAGLGLLNLDDEVPLYGATLAARHADSVVAASGSRNSREVRREWWEGLTNADVLQREAPARLENVACGEHGSVVVCVGREYADAVAPDLVRLAARLSAPEKLMVFGSGAAVPGLEDHWVRVDGRLRLALGGSMSSTSVRTAAAMLREVDEASSTVAAARSFVANLGARTGELPSLERRRMSDGQILGWIGELLQFEPGMTKTVALRRFRDQGNACEQSRFSRLFAEAVGSAT